MIARYSATLMVLYITTAMFGLRSSAAAQGSATDTGEWVLPRTPDGHPDLQGNWTNVTVTPIQRPAGAGPGVDPRSGGGDRGDAGSNRRGGLHGKRSRSGASPDGWHEPGLSRWRDDML